MRHSRHPRSRRPQSLARVTRFKRPLVVLTYRDNQLDAIHSSTPSVQFVRLDVTAPKATHEPAAIDPCIAVPARQFNALALSDMPADWRQTAQRAFRHPAKD